MKFKGGVLAATLLASLAMPSGAYAGHNDTDARAHTSCWCDVFSGAYTRFDGRGSDMRLAASRAMIRRGVGPVRRRQVKVEVYDWNDNNAFNESFCKRHRKICQAAVACMVTAGSYLAGAIGDGRITRGEFIQAGGICGSAAATVLLTP